MKKKKVSFELYNEAKEEAVLSAVNLKQLGFKKSDKKDLPKHLTIFDFEDWEVRLNKNKPEDPDIRLYTSNEFVSFPGAYTLKDLKFLLFFFYGEDNYSAKF